MFTNAYVRDYQIQNLVEAKFVQKSCQPIVYSTKVNLSFYKEMHVRLEGNRLLSDLASLYAFMYGLHQFPCMRLQKLRIKLFKLTKFDMINRVFFD